MLDLHSTDRIKTFGNSMHPVLQDGDIVFYRHIPFKNILINDIIVFKLNERYITHRVIYKAKNYVIAKGDKVYRADPIVNKKQIIGKVMHIVRNRKKIIPDNLYLIQSSHYFKEIVFLTKIFTLNKIRFVILKGLPLHLYYEKHHPNRIYTDCDILIDPKDFHKVDQLLTQNNYIKARISFTTFLPKSNLAESTYYKNKKGFVIAFDIHTEPVFMMTTIGISNIFYPTDNLYQLTQDLLQNQRKLHINNVSLPILSAEYLVIYLALHFFHHNFRLIHRLEIIANVIASEDINRAKWEKTAKYIVSKKLQNFIFPVFLMLRKYYQSPVPTSFIKQIKPKSKVIQLISKLFSRDIFNGETRFSAGLRRFMLLFIFSPRPLILKLSIVFSYKIWKMIIKIIFIKIKYLIKAMK